MACIAPDARDTGTGGQSGDDRETGDSRLAGIRCTAEDSLCSASLDSLCLQPEYSSCLAAVPRRAWGIRLDRQAAQAVTCEVDVRAKSGEARLDDGQVFSWVLFSSGWVRRRGTSSACLGPPMAPEPISAPTLSAPRPIAPRHDGRAAARYRHSFDDQSSVWCLEAGLRGFTQGAQAGGRLVLRRALPENDAAATHHAFARRFIAKACSSAAEGFDRAIANRSVRHRPFGP